MFPSFLPIQTEDVLEFFWCRKTFVSEESLSGMSFWALLGSDFTVGWGSRNVVGGDIPSPVGQLLQVQSLQAFHDGEAWLLCSVTLAEKLH